MSKRSEALRQNNRKKAEEHIQSELKRFHSMGILRGAYAMCQAVLQRAQDESKPVEVRMADVIAFCEKAKNPDENPDDTPVETEVPTDGN